MIKTLINNNWLAINCTSKVVMFAIPFPYLARVCKRFTGQTRHPRKRNPWLSTRNNECQAIYKLKIIIWEPEQVARG